MRLGFLANITHEPALVGLAKGFFAKDLGKNVKNQQFVAGFGSNGGEEFLSFLNISEALVVKGGKDWEEGYAKMTQGMEKAQDKDGGWSGHHCITGKTFCTAGALLVLMADRTPFPVEVLDKANQPADPPAKPGDPPTKPAAPATPPPAVGAPPAPPAPEKK